MDWANSLALRPPAPPRSIDDVFAFSAEIRRQFGAQWVDWPALIADAVLIKRELIDRIGVFDAEFPGFMADIDYGLRAQRAGYANVIALGAWLHHAGGGTRAKNEQQAAELTATLAAAYARFKQKWPAPGLPEQPMQISQDHVRQLLELPPLPGNGEYTPPMKPDQLLT
jgi:GT2 family glycosyltransferase